MKIPQLSGSQTTYSTETGLFSGTAEDNELSPLQAFVENDSIISPDKQMPYILMIFSTMKGIDLQTHPPYCKFHNCHGCVKDFRVNKKYTIKDQERFCCRGTSYCLQETCLTDPGDIAYVEEQERMYRELFDNKLLKEEEKQNNGRQRETDCLRFC